MTDLQLFISIRKRSQKRPSNSLFVEIVSALETEVREHAEGLPDKLLEHDVMKRFANLCQIYGITLDETEMKHIMKGRLPVCEMNRKKRLWKVGFGV